VGQPEMQPEGRPQNGRGELRGEGASAWLRRPGQAGPGDLGGRVFPLGDWGEPAARLDELYRWVERGALETAAWYLADRVRKRRCARALRVGAAAGVVTGAALPLLDLAGAVSGVAPWGYLALLLGAACVAGDRFFGVTSGWMRDVATAQAVQRRLQALQFDWASECVREVLGPAEGTAGEAAERCLNVLRRFSEDITELVRVETADWMVEFRTGTAPLSVHTAVANGARQEQGASPNGRIPSPPGHQPRPNMPRQRPPEPR